MGFGGMVAMQLVPLKSDHGLYPQLPLITVFSHENSTLFIFCLFVHSPHASLFSKFSVDYAQPKDKIPTDLNRLPFC